MRTLALQKQRRLEAANSDFLTEALQTSRTRDRSQTARFHGQCKDDRYSVSVILLRCSSPQSAIDAITGRSVFPSAVRRYSVLGGMTGYSRREIRPNASSSRNSLVRMRSLTGGHALRTSENRKGSVRTSAQTILAFHFPPRMREVNATGHLVANCMEITLTKRSVLVKS